VKDIEELLTVDEVEEEEREKEMLTGGKFFSLPLGTRKNS
jgi:hypothetical protein